MHNIVGRENLEAVNLMADECLGVLHQLKNNEKDVILIDKQFVQRLAQGYLFMYNKSIEHSMMPSIKTKPHLYDDLIQ